MKNWYGVLGGRRNRLHQNIDVSIADLATFMRPTLTSSTPRACSCATARRAATSTTRRTCTSHREPRSSRGRRLRRDAHRREARERAVPQDGPRARPRHHALAEPAARGGLVSEFRRATRPGSSAPAKCRRSTCTLVAGPIIPAAELLRSEALAAATGRKRRAGAPAKSSGQCGCGKAKRRRARVGSSQRSAPVPRRPCRASQRARARLRARRCVRTPSRDAGAGPAEGSRQAAEEGRAEAPRLRHPGAQDHSPPGVGCGASRRSASSRSSCTSSSRRPSAARSPRVATRRCACRCRSRRFLLADPFVGGDDAAQRRTRSTAASLWSLGDRRAHAGLRARVLRLDLPVRHAAPLLRLDLPVALRQGQPARRGEQDARLAAREVLPDVRASSRRRSPAARSAACSIRSASRCAPSASA